MIQYYQYKLEDNDGASEIMYVTSFSSISYYSNLRLVSKIDLEAHLQSTINQKSMLYSNSPPPSLCFSPNSHCAISKNRSIILLIQFRNLFHIRQLERQSGLVVYFTVTSIGLWINTVISSWLFSGLNKSWWDEISQSTFSGL